MAIEEKSIKDLKSLVNTVLGVNKRFNGQVWWRGQGCHSWNLSPSVARARSRGGYEYEQNVITRFKQRAPSRYPYTPAVDDIFGWLFLMQHHRLPTRLLDWTESPLFACYFAIEGENTKDDDASLFALSPYLLNQSQIGISELLLPHAEKAINAARKAFDRNFNDVDYVVGLLPSETHIRIMVQLSVFTLHGNGRPLDDLPDKNNFLLKFHIPKKSKALLKEQLKYLSVRESILFPDLDHLANETKALIFRQPPKTEHSTSKDDFSSST